ncbi:methyltransferase [Histoplasma capsulatum G186AR]|uniref:Methyltransferase n=1 Tax=Ajellomyces capsulatus TaxID=5037 RepID=A0A8H7Z565_AJECA|nr:methyltransferase [Histoplasma capsulatum]QSS69942.1 methyltransferase [Histoplasma capsulatum G186AR]
MPQPKPLPSFFVCDFLSNCPFCDKRITYKSHNYLCDRSYLVLNPQGVFQLTMAANHPIIDTRMIEAEETVSDSDSAYEGSLGDASYTASVTSSIMNYKYVNGRRYHAFKEGEYILPNDEQEQDRMDLNHHIYRTLLDGALYLAPVPESVRRVLDLGTGTGIWAIDFADDHPGTEVVGNDLSPIQPSWVPPNCKFEVDDFESTWSYAQPFDFIHAREMEGMVKDYDKLFQQAYKHLNPQGWMEIQSIELDFFGDETIVKAKEFRRWRELVIEASEKFGKPMTQVSTWADRMKKVGFKNVKAEHRILPFSPWPKNEKLKELGRYHQLQMFQALGAYSSAPLIRILGWKPSEVEILLAAVRRDLKDRSIHIYTKVHFIYGQKVVD